jgi:hypothetical protein
MQRVGVCVFCGSYPGFNPAYIAAARELGALLATEGFDVIYGGATDGCMGALADGALSRDGQVTGVAPPFVNALEHRHRGLTHWEGVASLAQRKLRMLDLSKGVIVLPGGTGTLDEFLEVLTMKRLALVLHPLIVIDVAGFFRPLHSLLQHLIESGFAGSEQLSLYRIVADPPSAINALREAFPL